MTDVLSAARQLAEAVDALRFAPPVTHVYNPLRYAWAMHAQYLERFGLGRKTTLFLGMNPGPFGMVQTGVPFGEVAAVRDWLRLDAPVGRPEHENPKRPVEGLACARSEVSGRRLWGLFAERYGTPEAFFADSFVANYCPLAFLDNTRNVTPDKLPTAEAAPLIDLCDEHLRQVVRTQQPDRVIGIGKYARAQAERALKGMGVAFGDILHPSPASPAANRGWAEQATRQLITLGIWEPEPAGAAA